MTAPEGAALGKDERANGALLAKGWVWDAVLVGMVTMYLSASEELAPVETIRKTLRAVAKKAGRRYAEARNSAGDVVATVEV